MKNVSHLSRRPHPSEAHYRWSNRKIGPQKSRNKLPTSRNSKKRLANLAILSRKNGKGPFARNRRLRMRNAERRKLLS